MTTWLYRSESKGIQGYVLGTSRLREIAGASDLINTMADQAKAWLADPRCAGARLFSAAAGGLTVTFADEESLKRFASSWPMLCERTRPGLVVTQAWVELAGDSPTRAEWTTLFERLEQDRARPMISLPEAGPLAERAGRTGLAAVEAPVGKALIDAPTRAKTARARDAEPLDDRFDTLLLDGKRFVRGRTEHDFDDGYVAVVHADGNGVGKRFMAVKTLSDLESLSTELQAATERATRRAIAHVARLRADDRAWKRDREVPMRPVVLGGDDVTILTRAADALPFAWAFLVAFGEETRAFPGGGMTASAGVALVKESFPYHAAYDLSEELCAFAKKRTRENLKLSDDAPTPAALMFHRVTTAAVRPWSEIRETELDVGGIADRLVGGPWTLSDGPWSLAALHRFASLVRAHAAPKGTLREWLTEVTLETSGGVTREGAIWRRMLDIVERDRHGEGREARAAIEAALNALGVSDGAWRKHPERDEPHTTPVSDALSWLAVDPEVAFEAEVAT